MKIRLPEVRDSAVSAADNCSASRLLDMNRVAFARLCKKHGIEAPAQRKRREQEARFRRLGEAERARLHSNRAQAIWPKATTRKD